MLYFLQLDALFNMKVGLKTERDSTKNGHEEEAALWWGNTSQKTWILIFILLLTS